jgi:hypothetical protein
MRRFRPFAGRRLVGSNRPHSGRSLDYQRRPLMPTQQSFARRRELDANGLGSDIPLSPGARFLFFARTAIGPCVGVFREVEEHLCNVLIGHLLLLAGSARTDPGSVNADPGLFLVARTRAWPTVFAVAEAGLPRELRAFCCGDPSAPERFLLTFVGVDLTVGTCPIARIVRAL